MSEFRRIEGLLLRPVPLRNLVDNILAIECPVCKTANNLHVENLSVDSYGDRQRMTVRVNCIKCKLWASFEANFVEEDYEKNNSN